MNSDIQLSVIIPVYNTQDYLNRCLDSIIACKGISMEIILVDDGSTDNSPAICDHYSASFPNVITLHTKNAGPASAKNRGLDIAKGKYVAMIDSDDQPETDMFSCMVGIATTYDADIVCCNYKERFEDGTTRTFDYTDETITLDNYSGIEYFLTRKKIYTQCWTKIYRRQLLEQHSIRNEEGLKTDEDFIFNIRCFTYAQTTCIVDKPLYTYSVRGSSLSKDYFNKDINNYINNRLLHFDIVDKLLDEHAPGNKGHAVFSRLYYSNELLGRIALFPGYYSDSRTRKVLSYMRRHITSVIAFHREIGFSLAGCLLLLLPTSMYMKYRKRKIS